MSDPYNELGLTRYATDDQIKAAYRALARKYHPDSYQGNPLADLAGEKMREINEAYDQIIEERRGQGGGAGGVSYGGGSSYADIRRLLAARRMTEAEELLDGVPRPRRDAEWHFLKGTVLYSRGWLEDAYSHFAHACELDPASAEYKAALEQLHWQQRSGRAFGRGGSTQLSGNGCSPCDICMALYCANCFCDCLR